MRGDLDELSKMTQDRLASREEMLLQISKRRQAKKIKRREEPRDKAQSSKLVLREIDHFQYLPMVSRHSGLLFEGVLGLQNNSPLRSYQEAAALLLSALENKGIYCLLSWPTGFEWPGLIAALASRSLSEKCTDEVNLRAFFYPSSRTTTGRFNGIRIPCEAILAEPKSLLYKGKIDLSPRHQALLCLNDLNDLNDNRRHPTLKDLTPTFEWNKEEERWIKYGPNYLEDIYRLMGSATPRGRSRASRRSVIPNYADTFNDPDKTPEGIFQIPGSVAPKVAVRILKKANADIVIIDVRDKCITRLTKMLEHLVSLAEYFSKESERPSLFVLFNDLPYLTRFKNSLLAAYKNVNKKAKRQLKPLSNFHWLRLTDSIYGSQASAIYWPENVICHVADASSLHAVSQLNEMARYIQSNGDHTLAGGIRKLAGFLRLVIDLPVGQELLQKWMSHTTQGWSENDAVRYSSRFLWSTYFRKWKNDHPEHVQQYITEKINTISSRALHGLTSESAIQNKVGDLIKPLINSRQKVLVLINDHPLVDPVKKYLSSVVGETGDSYIDVTCFSKMKSFAGYDAFIVAGFNRYNYKYIFDTANRIPKQCHLVSGAYSAAQIQRDFELLSSIDSYKSIHPFINKILDQINRPLSSFKKLGIPLDLNYKSGESIFRSYEEVEQTEAYAIIDLQNHAPLEVGEHSKVMRQINDSTRRYEVVYPEDIVEDDAILAMDEAFTSEIEGIVDIKLTGQNESQIVVRSYFVAAKLNIASRYPQKTRMGRSKAVLNRMKELDPECVKELNINMVQRWIKHIEDFEVHNGEDDISSGSAREKEHFLLFASALNMGSDLADIIWQQGIKTLRVNHMQEGRQTNNLIRQLLTGSLSYQSFNIDENSYQGVVRIAEENTFQVEMITYLEQHTNGGAINA